MEKIRIVLKDTINGVTKELFEEYFNGFEFNWEENNDSCDCNRAIKFYNLDLNSFEYGQFEKEWPCGNSRFRIIDCDIKELIEN